MEGYVRNASPVWRHALKRSIAPGEKIPLDELYEQYGVKHGIEPDKSFADWLRQVKLRDTEIWEIRYKGDESATTVDKAAQNKDEPAKVETHKKVTQQSPFVKLAPQVNDIANWSVRQARELLPKFTDQKTLKYALNIASQLSNKDTICRMFKKRLNELELSRR